MSVAPPHPLPVLFASAALLASAAPAPGGPNDDAPPRVLLGRDLSERPVRLVRLDASSDGDGSLTFIDEAGVTQKIALDQLLAILPPRPRAPGALDADPAQIETDLEQIHAAGPRGWLTLVDSQRFAGAAAPPADRQAPSAADDDSIWWRSTVFGDMAIPIARLAALDAAAPADARAPAAPDQDTVVMTNGDVISGLVGRAAPAPDGSLALFIDAPAGPTSVPFDRVARIVFANPPEPARGMRLWLSDGSTAVVRSIVPAPSGVLVSIEPVAPGRTPPPVAVAMEQIAGLVPDAAHLVHLASRPPAGVAPLGGRRRTEPPLRGNPAADLADADIVLPGPMRVEWAVPEGTRRFVATAELDPSCLTWGDAELVVSTGAGRELFRARLNADTPAARADVAMDPSAPGPLVITLEPGEFGPIQDRVILRRPLLLVAPRP